MAIHAVHKEKGHDQQDTCLLEDRGTKARRQRRAARGTGPAKHGRTRERFRVRYKLGFTVVAGLDNLAVYLSSFPHTLFSLTRCRLTASGGLSVCVCVCVPEDRAEGEREETGQ